MNYDCPHCQRSLARRLLLPRSGWRYFLDGYAKLLCPFCRNPIRIKRHELEVKFQLWGMYALMFLAVPLMYFLSVADVMAPHHVLMAFGVLQLLGYFVLIAPRLQNEPRYVVVPPPISPGISSPPIRTQSRGNQENA